MDEIDAAGLLDDDEHAINQETLEALVRDAKRYNAGGKWLFLIAVVVGLGLIAVFYHLTAVYVTDLNRAKDPQYMLPLLLLRGTLFGGLSVGFLYGLFTVGNAYVDQSTRFRKRLYSAHMLNYAFRTFRDDIKQDGKVNVADLVRLFEAWNANVDSAFSRVAFQKRSKNLVIGNGAHRFAVEDPPNDGDD
ncbi:MAG TPA: hypothetical protein VG944_19355 [Fimbriimonas sp.]|nr:hypothetical protein [Fimbriimonas sp.]